MSREKQQPRRPATKLANLRKKMAQSQTTGKAAEPKKKGRPPK